MARARSVYISILSLVKGPMNQALFKNIILEVIV